MARLRLIHWNEAECAERAGRLRRLGHTVEAWHRADGPAVLRELAASPPDAVVIDLTRIPSHGREVGVVLRTRKATRDVALVFVEGAPEKVARVKQVLPDAEFVTWRGIRGGLTRALRPRRKPPVVPSSNLAAYAGTPLPRKLGIKPGSVTALLGAPEGFERTLGTLPAGARLLRDARAPTDLTLFFARSERELARRIGALAKRAAGGGLWLVWPKRASGVASDLTGGVVRRVGLDAGLVDFKVCSVDATWSGLRFTRR